MDSKVQKYVLDYFLCLENAYNTFKNTMSDCHKITIKLFSLMERQKKLQKTNIIDTPLEKFENIIQLLTFQINRQINLQLSELQKHSHALQEIHQNLERKRTNLRKGCDELDFKEKSHLVNGSAFQPRLSDLIEFSQDGVVFSLGVCAQIKYVITAITLNENQSDSSFFLAESFKFDNFTEKRIKGILMLTQFCNKNENPS